MRIKELSERHTLENIIAALDKLQLTRERMRYSSDRLVDMEIAVVRMCEKSLDESNAALAGRISELETALSSGNLTVKAPAVTEKKPAPAQPKKETKPKTEALPATDKPQTRPVTQWAEIIARLVKINPPAAGFLQGAKAVREGNRLVLSNVINFVADDFKKNGKMKEALETAASEVLKETVTAAIADSPAAPTEQKKDADPFDDILERARQNGIPIE